MVIDGFVIAQETNMAHNIPLVMRVMASSITAANRAGKIIRDVMSQGELGIVEKVNKYFSTCPPFIQLLAVFPFISY